MSPRPSQYALTHTHAHTHTHTHIHTFIQTHTTISIESTVQKTIVLGFPGGAVVENLPANAGHTGSSPGLGGSHMPRSD